MVEFWCDVCGDIVRAVYPCKFTFHDGQAIPINICPPCMKEGKLVLDLPRRRLICVLLETMKGKAKWRARGSCS